MDGGGRDMRAVKPLAIGKKGKAPSAPKKAGKRSVKKRFKISMPTSRYAVAGVLAVALAGALAITVWSPLASGLMEKGVANVTTQFHRLSVSAGLAIGEIFVTGRSETGQEEILKSLQISRGQSILSFEPKTARERLMKLGWVKDARVERRLPDTVIVYLQERRPLALWQRDGRHLLIDREGVVITRRDLGRFASLPVVIGNGAPEHAAELMDMLAQEPLLFTQVEAAVRIGDRRWNLRMKNGIDINLPEEGAYKAWSRLAKLVAEHRIFERDVAVIDLRLPDRLVVRLTPKAASKRRLPEKDT
jgi:cell division protein FtsQ